MVVRFLFTGLRLICKSVPTPSLKVCSFERTRFFSKRFTPVVDYKMSQGDANDLLPLQNVVKEKVNKCKIYLMVLDLGFQVINNLFIGRYCS